MSKGFQVAGGATLIALLLGWYALSNLEAGASFTYYQSLEEFTASVDAQAGQPARVHGYVSEGTIERDVGSRSVRFAVQNEPPHGGGSSEGAMDVVFASLETPDLFKDGAEVVLEGRLLREGSIARVHADKLLAKCPSKFEGQEGGPPSTES
ncbi:MAG: cytochrome c maturation protein CcmE [Myxococcota bacterium]